MLSPFNLGTESRIAVANAGRYSVLRCRHEQKKGRCAMDSKRKDLDVPGRQSGVESGKSVSEPQADMGTAKAGRGVEGSPDVTNIPGSTNFSGIEGERTNQSRSVASQVDMSSVNKDRLDDGNRWGSNQAGMNPPAGGIQPTSDRGGNGEPRQGLGPIDRPDLPRH